MPCRRVQSLFRKLKRSQLSASFHLHLRGKRWRSCQIWARILAVEVCWCRKAVQLAAVVLRSLPRVIASRQQKLDCLLKFFRIFHPPETGCYCLPFPSVAPLNHRLIDRCSPSRPQRNRYPLLDIEIKKQLGELARMSAVDDFTLVSTSSHHKLYDDFEEINSGKLESLRTSILAALRREYPE